MDNYRIKALGQVLGISAAVGMLCALTHVATGFREGFTPDISGLAAVNFASALLGLAAWRALKHRWFNAVSFLISLQAATSVIYGMVLGRGINLVALLFAAYMLYLLHNIQKQNKS